MMITRAADRLDLGHDVRREQDRVPLAQLADQGADLADLDRVEPGRRLVEDQDVGVVDHRLGQPDALADSPWRDGRGCDPRPRRAGSAATTWSIAARRCERGDVLELGPEGQVLADPHLGVERHVLGQVADLAADLQRLVEHVVPGERGAAAGRRRGTSSASASSSSCPPRWGRAGRRSHPGPPRTSDRSTAFTVP